MQQMYNEVSQSIDYKQEQGKFAVREHQICNPTTTQNRKNAEQPPSLHLFSRHSFNLHYNQANQLSLSGVSESNFDAVFKWVIVSGTMIHLYFSFD